MPRGDHTGPEGEGPMTGRRLGHCAGKGVPGSAASRRGRGGQRSASRRSTGRRPAGRGGRRRNRFYATGVPGWAHLAPEGEPGADESEWLKARTAWLRDELDAISQRLEALDKPK
jgi:hypothetical protein